MKKYLFFCFFILAACNAGNKIMTTESFSEVEIGMTEKELKAQLGEPNSVKHLNNNEKEYQYIEKITAYDRIVEMKYYFFTIKNGIVTSKRMKEGADYQPILERNAYELQTSFNKEE